MAWAGDDDEDDEFNCTPIEEILAVTREDQDMLTEAHKALRREIKSIRKSLKKLVRQFYTYADAQASNAPEWSDVSVAESDIHNSKDNHDETVSDFTTDNEYKHDDQRVRDHSESEALKDIDDVALQRQRRFSYNSENNRVDNNDDKLKGNRRRPESTPPIVQNNTFQVSPRYIHLKPKRNLARESSTPFIANQSQDLLATMPERPSSQNSDDTETYSTVEDDITFTDLESEQFNNTYPGASSYHTTAQHTATKSLRNFGRRDAQHQFSRRVLKEQSKTNGSNSPQSVDDGSNNVNGHIQAKPQLTEFSPGKISEQYRKPPPLQRRFTQEEIRQAGSQLRIKSIPSTRHMRHNDGHSQMLEKRSLHPDKEIVDAAPPSLPPPPPPEHMIELPGMEDQLGEILEFSNSFQNLPRRLSSSEISSIGGGVDTRSNRRVNVKKLIRTGSHPITVAQHAQVAT